MLRLVPARPLDTLWDTLLPEGVRVLPEDLGAIDELLRDPALTEPFRAHWRAADRASGRSATTEGRPTIPMVTYVRLMVLKHRCGWGYETLLCEVSDSLHLRRFCLFTLEQAVPSESTVRKMTRRLGPELVDELIRGLIKGAVRERRFRPHAMRTDSTVVEADIRHPTDAGLALVGARLLAKQGRKVVAVAGGGAVGVRNRSRSINAKMRAATRSLRRRSGEAKAEVLALIGQAGELLAASVREAKRTLTQARGRARGRGARAKLAAARELEELAERCEQVVEQIRKRVRGDKITNRLVSFFDTDARPVRRGKIAKPTEFGYVCQLAELTANTGPGARGLILPPKLGAGSVHENTLLPETVAELSVCGLSPREAAFDGGFALARTQDALASTACDIFITGRTTGRSRRSAKRLRCYRTGCEGRISHLKRRYGAGRSKLRGTTGAQIWEGWAVFTYNAETVARLKR